MEMLIVLIVSIIKSYTVRGIETLDLKPELKALLKSKQEKHGCEKGNTRKPISRIPNSTIRGIQKQLKANSEV